MDYARNIKATKRSSHPYVDNYTGFTWNNIHSSRYNCFIENTGHLNFEPAPSFSNNFINPMFQNRNYYTGMQSQTKKVQLKLVFYQLTLADLNEAMEWLNRTKISDLLFDYEPYWKYCCKLASIGTMEKYVDGYTIDRNTGYRQDLYIGRVDVTFETVYQPDAISIYTVYHSTRSPDSYWVRDQDHPSDESLASPFTVKPGNQQFLVHMSSAEDHSDLVDDLDVSAFFAPTIQFPLVEHIGRTATEGSEGSENGDVLGNKHWTIILRNPTPRPTFFKLHCYDIVDTLKLDYVATQGADSYTTNGPIDAPSNPITIAQAVLSLDTGHSIHLHYNSEDGSLLTANQSIESMQGLERRNICIFAQSLSNICIPGAVGNQYGQLQLELYGSNDWSVEYDIYNSMI